MWEDILKTINLTTGKTKTVNLPIIEDDDDECEKRFWELWEKLKLHMSFFKIRKPYWLTTTSLTIVDTTDRDYCAIIEYLKGLENKNWLNDNYEWDVGDTLNIWFIRHRFTTKNNENKIRYAIEIYQNNGSPHPLFQIDIYDKEEFIAAIRRFA